MPENPEYVDIPEPETTAAPPRRLSPTLRALWVASIIGFAAATVTIYALADQALYGDRSTLVTTVYVVGQAMLQVSVFGILVSAVLTWWGRREPAGR